ncbi:VOC family protein [Parablautia intestinalis]|uniref:VOC family protein n=1 Tax=Parablautia intestinalis TaxID=2320100 RepID=UPI00256F1CAD|nr:VOC family protein [Parablautia intestinalis]
MSKPTIDVKGLCHFVIIVNDIHKAAAEWGRLLGLKESELNLRVRGNNQAENVVPDPRNHYRGDHNFGNGKEYEWMEADIQMGGWMIELIQPGEKGPFREYYEKHGTGIHHIAFRVGDKCDEINDMLEADGYDYIVDCYSPNNDRWPVHDTEDVLGTNLCIKPGLEQLTEIH